MRNTRLEREQESETRVWCFSSLCSLFKKELFLWNPSLCWKQLRVQSRNGAIATTTGFEDSFNGHRSKNHKMKLISAQRCSFFLYFYATAFRFSIIINFKLFKKKFINEVSKKLTFDVKNE